MKLLRLEFKNGNGPFVAGSTLEYGTDDYECYMAFKNLMPHNRVYNEGVRIDVNGFCSELHYVAVRTPGELYAWFRNALWAARIMGFRVVEIDIDDDHILHGKQQAAYIRDNANSIREIEINYDFMKLARKQYRKIKRFA